MQACQRLLRHLPADALRPCRDRDAHTKLANPTQTVSLSGDEIRLVTLNVQRTKRLRLVRWRIRGQDGWNRDQRVPGTRTSGASSKHCVSCSCWNTASRSCGPSLLTPTHSGPLLIASVHLPYRANSLCASSSPSIMRKRAREADSGPGKSTPCSPAKRRLSLTCIASPCHRGKA